MRRTTWEIVISRKPFFYAKLYLLLIPIFALVYSIIHRDFYFFTTKYEHSAISEKAGGLNKKIKAIIVKSYLDNHLADLHRVDTAFHINDIVITDFKYENATFFFKLSFSLEEWFSIVKRSRTFHKGRIPPYDYNLSFPMIEFSSVMNTQFPGARIIRVENLKSDTIPEEISRVFRPLPYENLPIIEINSIKSDLKEYAGLIDGSPISFLDNYSRMFYLSSVTITTSGFGDIVPITNRARMIISIEALLGIIIAGLFLNAINRVTHQ